MVKKISWLCAALVTVPVVILVVSACSHQNDQFYEGRSLVIAGQYERGRQVLEAFLTQHANSKEASRAHFFIAKSFLGSGDYEQARAGYKRVLKRFPNTPEARKSAYKLALIHMLVGENSKALAGFKNIKQGPLLPEAEAMVRYLQQLEAI